MVNFHRGDRVRIHTVTHGCYDGLTGTVVNLMTSDEKAVKADESGFLDWHMCADGWYRVRFDKVVLVDRYAFGQDIFQPMELEKIEEA